MSGAFQSDMWYRVAELRPKLHGHVRICRQRFRGRAWYLLADRASNRVHRFTPAIYALIHGMDGEHSVDELWATLAEKLGDNAPSQDDVIQLLYRLHAADVLQAGVPPDIAEMVERKRRTARSGWLRNVLNPMAVRLPLWDPQGFLNRAWPLVRPLMSPFGALLWLAVVGIAAVAAAAHWRELTENLSDRVLGLQNLFLLWLTYPLVKLCHELGHAFAVRRGGGEVHELGIMFLVLAPVPYVDASASSAFRSKWARMGVGAAGILVELFLAALALFVWLALEPGLLRAMAFNVMLIGGVSTVLFNGNPLLRFDGYYILSDFLEIPNLAQRSGQYLSYLVKRHGFGQWQAESPSDSPGESFWLALYQPVSWIYRLLIMVSIALFVASKYFFIGVGLALWSVLSMLVIPLGRGLSFVLADASVARQRRRALLTSGAAAGLIILAALFLPLPDWTNAEGVVWVPANAEVRAGAGGFVTRVIARPGAAVAENQALLQLSDPDLEADMAVRRASVDQLEVQLASQAFNNQLKADLTRRTLEAERAVLARLEHRADELICVAARSGNWVVPNAGDLDGRFFPQGALLGYVVSGALRTVRVVVTQEEGDLVRSHTRGIALRLADRPDERLRARAVREVPGGSQQLPSRALALEGGGRFATDPRDTNGLNTLARTFQFDLELDTDATDLSFGTRAYVRFEHQPQPLAVQVYRRLRQLLLARLVV
ncbi:MAG: peptidase M50 [Rhodocyclaceae bacterium]|nr:peptidase M50 [Rhodocyclaceae bacterium]